MRLFVALEIPAAVRRDRLPRARWVEPELFPLEAGE